jgi:hypothetical protein
LKPPLKRISRNSDRRADVDGGDHAALDQSIRRGSGNGEAIGDLVDPQEKRRAANGWCHWENLRD